MICDIILLFFLIGSKVFFYQLAPISNTFTGQLSLIFLVNYQTAEFFTTYCPCGEGAGYAGGIVSAGIDGERCAEAVATYLGIEED